MDNDSGVTSDDGDRANRNRRINAAHAGAGKLLTLLADRLPDETAQEMSELNFAGETRFLMNWLCARLINKRVPVTVDERDAIGAVLALFDGESERFPLTSSSTVLTTLASLHVRADP